MTLALQLTFAALVTSGPAALPEVEVKETGLQAPCKGASLAGVSNVIRRNVD